MGELGFRRGVGLGTPYPFNNSGIYDIGFLGMQFANLYICYPLAMKIHNVNKNMFKSCCAKFFEISVDGSEIMSH